MSAVVELMLRDVQASVDRMSNRQGRELMGADS
jgi:hypothetical protein